MLKELCQQRGLMPVWEDTSKGWDERRKEIAEILCREEYGFMPKEHDGLTWEVESENDRFCAGRVTLRKVILTAIFGEDRFSFPVYTSIPKTTQKLPFFVHINFRDNVPDQYLPVEEICDRGFAVLSFCYKDVAADDREENVTCDPLPELLYKGIEKQPYHAGKIRMWAWAASRVLDYALTISELDADRAAVIGHSRLGKTALVAGMLDERFKLVISNDSGCSGAAISRGKPGETIEKICDVFPYWFCDNYKKYAGKEDEQPFDQHWLVAASAPRHVCVGSAQLDWWADPASEFLSCYAASEVYQKLGLTGLVCDDQIPEARTALQEGRIGYHVRTGDHYLSREDWNLYMDYMEKHF